MFEEKNRKEFKRSRSRSPKSKQFNKSYSRYSDSTRTPITVEKGPLLFAGSVGATLVKKTPLPGVPQSQVPMFKQPERKIPTSQKQQVSGKEEQYDAFVWEDINQATDRYWYDQDENDGTFQDDREEAYFPMDNLNYVKNEESLADKAQQRKNRMSAKAIERDMENQKWDLNRMMSCGVFKITQMADPTLIDEESDQKVTIQVHDIKPPFLDGKNIYTKQMEPIVIVKDPTCDMAILSKKGSNSLRLQRESNDKKRFRQKFWELQGTHMGNVLGIQKEANEDDKETQIIDDGGQVDYKKQNQFADSLKLKSEACSEFSRTKTLKQQREYLPVFSVREELLQVIHDHRVIIIVGETGSGKTTQLTQYLLEEGYGKNGIIGCTQPRRVAAVSVAKRVAEEMGYPLGTKVGYSIRFEDFTSKETKIKYMTDGVLLRESLNDPELELYSAVVMDEAHERSLNTDVLFGILVEVAKQRRDIKLIITSATMNAEKFSSFFGGAPIFTIPGRTFPVAVRFDKSAAEDYVDAAVKKTIEIHLQQPEGDILIFMTGQEDIETTCVLIAEKIEKMEKCPALLILPIYSQLRSEEQARIFEKSSIRKCIVATNIAETSLTLDGVKYVIDSGYCKLKVYNPRIGMDALQITPISQANANQRAGRAGRTGPGICYRLYSDSNFRSDMLENNIPEIQRTNLANVVLLLKSLNIDNLLEFNFMDPPSQETILNSMYQLWLLGCLNELGEITELGRTVAQFPCDPALAKMMITASDFGCSEEVITIVSMLQVPTIFYRPKDREQESDSAREKLIVPESDHLTLLNVYLQWQKHNYSAEWCSQCFVQIKSMRKVREIKDQLLDISKQQGLVVKSCNNDYDLVRKAICSAYFTNAAKIKSIGEYINLRTALTCRVHPSSALYMLGYTPDFVVYHELIMTSKEYMHCVTTVDPYWLAEMGPMFFSVKECFGNRQSKSELENRGKLLMEEQIELAKMKKSEIIKQKEEIEEKQRIERRMKSALVAQSGIRMSSQITPVNRNSIKTPRINHI